METAAPDFAYHKEAGLSERAKGGGEMTKILATAMGAMLLLAATPAAFASCAGDAAASRDECLRDSRGDRARAAECAAFYRDDLSECRRYERGPMMHRPAPKPISTPPHPMPPPPQRAPAPPPPPSPPPGHR